MAELVLDDTTGQYAYRTHYTAELFTTDRPWPVTVDLPALTAKRERLLRLAAEAATPQREP